MGSEQTCHRQDAPRRRRVRSADEVISERPGVSHALMPVLCHYAYAATDQYGAIQRCKGWIMVKVVRSADIRAEFKIQMGLEMKVRWGPRVKVEWCRLVKYRPFCGTAEF